MSKSKATRAEYEAAAKDYRAADENAKRLASRIDDIAARLLQARMESSRIDTEIDRFAIGDESADTLAKKAADLARNLGGRKSEIAAMISVLDRAHVAASEEFAAAKVKVLHAEAKALQLSRRYYDEAVGELCDEFVRANRERLLRLLQVSHAYGVVYGWKPYRSDSDGFYGVRSLANLFDTLLTEAADRAESNDRAYAEVLGTVEKSDPPTSPLRSEVVTSPERQRVHALSFMAGIGNFDAKLLDAVSQDDTPPPPEPMSRDERERLGRGLSEHEQLIERSRRAIASAEQQLSTLEKDDFQGGYERRAKALQEEIQERRRAIENSERAAAGLRDTLEADQALR
jgi:hypothetical protein